jgi:hypothetical protein
MKDTRAALEAQAPSPAAAKSTIPRPEMLIRGHSQSRLATLPLASHCVHTTTRPHRAPQPPNSTGIIRSAR